MTAIIDTSEGYAFWTLCTLKARLSLELKGLKGHGRTAYSQLKDFGYRGNRDKVYAQVCADVDARTIPRPLLEWVVAHRRKA